MVESYHEYTGSKGSTREKVTHTEHVELPDYTTYIDASDEVPDNLFPRHAGNIRVSGCHTVLKKRNFRAETGPEFPKIDRYPKLLGTNNTIVQKRFSLHW